PAMRIVGSVPSQPRNADRNAATSSSTIPAPTMMKKRCFKPSGLLAVFQGFERSKREKEPHEHEAHVEDQMLRVQNPLAEVLEVRDERQVVEPRTERRAGMGDDAAQPQEENRAQAADPSHDLAARQRRNEHADDEKRLALQKEPQIADED